MERKYLILIMFVSLSFILSACTQNMQQSRNCIMKMPVAAAGAKYVGNKACADCHEELVNGFKANVHGRIIASETPIGLTGCETCH